MAFNNIKQRNLDRSDVLLWKNSGCTAELIEQIQVCQSQCLQRLLKDGEKKHSENAEGYKAYGKILKLIEDA